MVIIFTFIFSFIEKCAAILASVVVLPTPVGPISATTLHLLSFIFICPSTGTLFII